MQGFQSEIKDLEDFDKYLRRCSEQIDSTLTEKEACKDKSFSLKLQINDLKTR